MRGLVGNGLRDVLPRDQLWVCGDVHRRIIGKGVSCIQFDGVAQNGPPRVDASVQVDDAVWCDQNGADDCPCVEVDRLDARARVAILDEQLARRDQTAGTGNSAEGAIPIFQLLAARNQANRPSALDLDDRV